MTRTGWMKAIALAAAVLLPALAGCSKKTVNNEFPNQSPTVRLTNAPTSTRQVDAYYYAITLNWVGFDPDGRVAYYLYVVDPPATGDTTWTRTEKNETVILFPSTQSNTTTGKADDPHTFVIKAVDDDGAISPFVYRSFFSFTTAPTVQILAPRPFANGRKYVTPAVRITWDGEDVDGVFTKKPVKYKYKMLTTSTEVTLSTALADRDSVRRYYAPRNWASWDSTTAENPQVSFTNLVPDQEYIFCVVAFDEAGAYSPVFTRSTNMLYFRVTFAGQNNPIITFFNEFFTYTYGSGSYEPNNRNRYVILELPAAQPITFNWFAVPVEGSEMRSYRWSLDMVDLSDETPRNSPTDYSHWSAASLNVTSATIGPFPGSATPHRFFLEAEDINGLKSLGIIEFTVVQATFEKSLLVVKDTRMLADNILPGQSCVDRPKGRWPTQAELDTFLFARGGATWRCYPAGTVTKPGLFSGFAFDTLGTRTGVINQTVPLSKLGQYQHVVWISDKNGTQSDNDGSNPQTPENALRYMCGPNRLNTLGAYLKQGGRVWLVGGGALTATVINFDRVPNNTVLPAPCQTFDEPNGELIPGRMAYDFAKWRSQIKDILAILQIRRDAAALGRNQSNPFYTSAALPASFTAHSEASGDSMPPNRTTRSDFFYTNMDIEYLSLPNDYQEDIDPTPGENFAPAIDSLYRAVGSTLVAPSLNPANTCMTVYPARELWGVNDFPARPTLIATGFDLWSFQRVQTRGLVDFVLGQLWGLPPAGPSARASRAAPATPGITTPAGGTIQPGTVSTSRSLRTAPTPDRKSAR